MARYQMVFRNGSERMILIDDDSPGGEAAYLSQRVAMGATITAKGLTWKVVEESHDEELSQFVCVPADVAGLTESR